MQNSHDVRSCILQKVDTFQQLGMMACTCKTFRDQIYATDKLWTDLGRRICGDEHWSHSNSTMSPRRLAMIRACPWMSEPKRFEVPILNNIRTLGGNVSIKQIEVVQNYCIFTATLRGGGLMRDGNFVEITTDAYGTTTRNDMVTTLAGPRLSMPPSPEDIDTMRLLNATQWRPHELYPSSPLIEAVRRVHDSLFMVFCSELNRSHAIIYFVSSRTYSVLYTYRCFMRPHWKTHTVFVRPGEIWIYEEGHRRTTLTYFGPVGNTAVNARPERGVRDAFWAAFRGDVDRSMELLGRHGFAPSEIYRLQEDRFRLVDAVMLSRNSLALDTLLQHLPEFADSLLLYKAIDMGSLAMAHVLLKHGVDPSDNCSEPMFRTVRSKGGTIELFKLLMTAGAVLYPCCMLYHIRPWTHAAIVDSILSRWTGSMCTHEENPLFVDWLLNGGDFSGPMRAAAALRPELVHQANDQGHTPLMLAAGSLTENNVRCLLDLKADIHARDTADHTALDWCNAASDSDLVPDWYLDAYTAFDAPAAFEFDEDGRYRNGMGIRGLLA
jgi:hypothetical protein